MEDPESEWEIQEYYYSPSSKTGDDHESSPSMVKWMLNRGFVIGKKLVITGIAISSAPLVVPPLVVFSAMGVAFSVPFGFVFASYAFTNKLMTTLLPTPPPPPPPPPPPLLLEYYHTPDDQYEQDKLDEATIIELDDGGISIDDYDQIHLVEVEDGYDQQYNEDDNVDENVQINDNNIEGEVFITKVEMVDVDEDSYSDENVVENDEKDGHLLQIENVTEEERRGEMEDIKQGVETRSGLDAACIKQKPSEQISSVTGFGVGVDDEGYEEDVGEYLEGDDISLEEPLLGVNKGSVIDVFEDDKEEIVKGSTGLLEKIRDEGRVDNVVADDDLLGEKASDLDDDKVKDFEAKEPVIVKEIGSQKLVDGSKEDETVGEMRHVVILSVGNEENNFNSRELEEIDLVASEVTGDASTQARDAESDEKVMRERMGTQEETGGNVSKSRELEESDLVASEVTGDANTEVKNAESDEKVMRESMGTEEETRGNMSNSREVEESDLVASQVMTDTNREARNTESDEKVMRESMETQEKTNGNNISDSRELEGLDVVASEVMRDIIREVRNAESDKKVMRESMGTQEKTGAKSEDVILRTKIEYLIYSDSDAKKVGGESGMDSVVKKDTNIDLKNLEAGDEAKEDNADESVDVLEALPTFEEAPLATDVTKVASKTKTKTNTKMPSREDILDDEKIWEKIMAMRTIVGYNAPSQETCIGELKALYVFTGVEPPPGSFKDDSDLDEVNAKLKFLMAIVGVK